MANAHIPDEDQNNLGKVEAAYRRAVEEIGRVKREAQLPIYEPKREEQVFANITACNHGPVPSDSVRRIFERIIDEMRTIQRRKIAPHPEDHKC